jgi:hypothetical protein
MFSKLPSLADTLPPEQQRASEAEIDLEKCRLLFQNAGVAQAIVSIDGAILVFILGGFRPPLWALVWLLARQRAHSSRVTTVRLSAAIRWPRLPRSPR